MKVEEAIKLLENTDHLHEPPNGYYEALDMAIEALRNEINCVKCEHYTEEETPTGIKGVCKMDTAHREDFISRTDALKPFCIAPDGTRIPEVDCDNFPVEFSAEFIKKHLLSLPSADRPTGEWIEDGYCDRNCVCSHCGGNSGTQFDGVQPIPLKTKFCPNCGAKMGDDTE